MTSPGKGIIPAGQGAIPPLIAPDHATPALSAADVDEFASSALMD